jgi:hypothetical protein
LHAPLGGQWRGLGQRPGPAAWASGLGQRLGQVERSARRHQQVVDDPGQALRALDDAPQRGTVLVGRTVAPEQGDLGLAQGWDAVIEPALFERARRRSAAAPLVAAVHQLIGC